MLTKLLKYDLKYMIKNMSVFYILAIFFGITTRILYSMEQSVMVDIISKISFGCMIAMIANIFINTIMRSWVRFTSFIYKDESYLTHTLPVTKNDIYNSKFIQTLIFTIFSLAIIIIALFIAFYTKDRWIFFKEYLNNTAAGIDLNLTVYIIVLILIFFLEIINIIQAGFLGIILGHKKNNYKIGFSILFGFIVYLLSQGLVILSVFIAGLFNSNIMGLFRSNNNLPIDSGTFKLLIILSIIIYSLVIGLMSIICKKEFNKGVNIE